MAGKHIGRWSPTARLRPLQPGPEHIGAHSQFTPDVRDRHAIRSRLDPSHRFELELPTEGPSNLLSLRHFPTSALNIRANEASIKSGQYQVVVLGASVSSVANKQLSL